MPGVGAPFNHFMYFAVHYMSMHFSGLYGPVKRDATCFSSASGLTSISEAQALFDTNVFGTPPQAANRVSAYDGDRDLVSKAIVRSVQKAPGPDSVAAAIVDAAFGNWRMRRTPKGEASLLSRLRRFMPAGPVDGSLRKTFGLG